MRGLGLYLCSYLLIWRKYIILHDVTFSLPEQTGQYEQFLYLAFYLTIHILYFLCAEILHFLYLNESRSFL